MMVVLGSAAGEEKPREWPIESILGRGVVVCMRESARRGLRKANLLQL